MNKFRYSILIQVAYILSYCTPKVKKDKIQQYKPTKKEKKKKKNI